MKREPCSGFQVRAVAAEAKEKDVGMSGQLAFLRGVLRQGSLRATGPVGEGLPTLG